MEKIWGGKGRRGQCGDRISTRKEGKDLRVEKGEDLRGERPQRGRGESISTGKGGKDLGEESKKTSGGKA